MIAAAGNQTRAARLLDISRRHVALRSEVVVSCNRDDRSDCRPLELSARVLDEPFELGAIVDIARRVVGRAFDACTRRRSLPDADALAPEGPGARS